MRKQKEMVDSFQMIHKEFMLNLGRSLDLLEHDIEEAREIDGICTGEWCTAIEGSIDELAKYIYSISEPRWVTDKQSGQLREMRHRVHDLYAKYRGVRSSVTH